MYSFNAEFCKQNSVLFCLPRPPEAVVFTAFKNPHRLYEKTSCFAVISQAFFSQPMPCGEALFGITRASSHSSHLIHSPYHFIFIKIEQLNKV